MLYLAATLLQIIRNPLYIYIYKFTLYTLFTIQSCDNTFVFFSQISKQRNIGTFDERP